MSMVRDKRRRGKRPAGRMCCAECGSFSLFRRLPALYFVTVGEVRLPRESDNQMAIGEYIGLVKRMDRSLFKHESGVLWKQTDSRLEPVAVVEAGEKGVTVKKIRKG